MVTTCTGDGLQAAVNAARDAGGGTITFACPSPTNEITLNRAIVLDEQTRNVTIDGGNSIVLKYGYPAVAPGTPPPSPAVCPTNSKYWYGGLLVNGSGNTIRNISTSAFPEGVQLRGANNTVDGLHVRVTCDEAVQVGAFFGTGSAKNRPAPGSVIRNSRFEGGAGGGKNKGIQINIGDVTIEGSTFLGINLPVRGVYETQRVVMRGNSFPTTTATDAPIGGVSGFAGQGPQFSSVAEPVIFENNTGSQKYGILVEGSVRAIVRNNVFTRIGSNGRNAILALASSRVWAEGNTMTGYTATNPDGGTVRVVGSAQVDLGGGSLPEFAGPSRGNNIIKNGRNGAPFDVKNETQTTVMAKGNYWDHVTAAEVMQYDVSGPVVVDPLAPAARIDGAYTGIEGSDVTFDGSVSSGLGLSYGWDFGDGSTGTGATPSHAYGDNGVFTVTLTVTDQNGSTSVTTTTATIANAVPTVDPLEGATLLQGESYTSSGSFDDPGADSWTATVDYGDGSGTRPLSLSGKGFTLAHTYTSAGTFTLTVAVTDDDRGVGEETALIRVLTPGEGIDVLSSILDELSGSGAVEQGNATALEATLRAASLQLRQGKPIPARQQLEAFINQVGGLVSGGRLPAADGATLTAQANRILRSIASL